MARLWYSSQQWHFMGTFIEVFSSYDPDSLRQQTEGYRTIFTLVRKVQDEVSNFRMTTAYRDGPMVEININGLPAAGPPLPMTLRTLHPVRGGAA
jgi:hypothetical protein